MGRARDVFSGWDAVVNGLETASAIVSDSAGWYEITRTLSVRTSRGVAEEEASTRVRSTATGVIDGASARVLSEKGYASDSSGTWEFEVPSPEVLRSEQFERDHCFAAPITDSTGATSISFVPASDRHVAEIAGELRLSRDRLLLLSVRIRYVRIALPAGERLATAAMEFAQDASGNTYLANWSLQLPRLVSGIDLSRPIDVRRQSDWRALPVQVVGTVTRKTELRFIDDPWVTASRDSLTVISTSATGNVGARVSCSEIGLPSCLQRGDRYLSEGPQAQAERLLAAAYYHKTCSSGPSKRLQQVLELTNSPHTADNLSEPFTSPVSRRQLRGALARGVYSENEIAAALRGEFLVGVQREACVAYVMSLLADADTASARKYADLLSAACIEGEGIGCYEAARLIERNRSEAGAARRREALLEQGCRLGVANACRSRAELSTPFDSLHFLIEEAVVGRRGVSAASIMKSTSRRLLLAAKPMDRERALDIVASLRSALPATEDIEVEHIHQGVLITLWPRRAQSTADDVLEPGNARALDALAAVLNQFRALKATAVFHTDRPPAAAATGISASSARRVLRHRADAWHDYLQGRGVDFDQFTAEIALWNEPAASEMSGLARRRNRRVEVAVVVR
jgi:hypothetical protein